MSTTPYRFWQLPAKEERKGIDSLHLRTASSLPEPGPDDVVLRVRAVSLNYLDPIVAKNEYPRAIKEDALVPCSDGAGEVISVGKRVRKFTVGDRAIANFNIAHLSGPVCSVDAAAYMLGFRTDGMLSEYVVLPALALVHVPRALTYEQAATLPCAAVTAWNALHGLRDVPLLPGATVVCQGTGGVSLFAAAFAIAGGARVVITSSSDEKLRLVRSLFTQDEQRRLFTVNYGQTPAWDAEVLKINPQGATHVIEIGGSSTLERAHACIKRGGVIANIGFVAKGDIPNVPSLNLASNSTYRGFIVGSVEHFEQMNECIDVCAITPLIDKIFPFTEAREAYAYVASGKHVGKVVIKMQD